LHHASAALVKSGTGTLESALAGTPLVIAYRMHPLSFALARRLVRVDHVGLVNLVAGERVAPEFIQGDATVDRLADALSSLLDPSRAERQRALAGIGRVRQALRAPGDRPAAERVADLAESLVTGST
jgi:lipid-A-disaccharide synthase